MTHEVDLILTLAGALFAALVFGLFTQRAGLSPIVGYLIAGVVVGPFTPGFVAHAQLAQELAEIGVVLLMFGVGLQFHVEELLAVRKVAIPGALVGVVAGAGAGIAITRFAGWGWAPAAIFGLSMSVTSTVVLLRVLADRGALQTPAGHVAVGWLVVEDLIAVLVLVVVPLVAKPSEGPGLAVAIGLAFLKVAALVAFTLLVGAKVIPWLLGRVAKTRSRDLFTLTVLVVALGIAVGATKLFGASMALGAFLAGMVVGRSEFAARAASEALPMRDAFAVLFFVSVGMMLDPAQIVPNWRIIAATIVAILVVKPLAAMLVMRVVGQAPRTAVLVSLSLGQIGEFSFIVATLGRDLGLLPANAMQVIVAASMVTITLSPLVLRLAKPIAARVPSVLEADVPPVPRDAHRAIVVGYGPVGQTVTRLLRENGIEPTVIEMNHQTVKELRKKGTHSVHGDAARREVLEHAGIRTARSLVFAASGSPADEVTRLAKELNPTISVLARSTYLREVAATKQAGADTVIAAEVEVALAMTEYLLTAFGATRDQLDEARERARADLEV